MKRSAPFAVVLCTLTILTVSGSFAAIIHVDASAAPGGDGQSWVTAYRFLQDALTAAGSGDEIWVAAGVYRPDRSEGNPTGSGDREASFVLKNGVGLYGGFVGREDSQTYDLDGRDFGVNETILTGDLNGDDDDLATGAAMIADSNRGENSYHIFKGTGISDTAVIDGFTITGGHATAPGNDLGGGLFNTNNSNPKLFNCLFTRNTAGRGGAIYNYRSSSRTDHCRFVDNAAIISGGAIHGSGSLVEMHITDSVFEDCFCEGWGGAIHNNDAIVRLENCRLVNNTVWKFGNTRGGAVNNENGSQAVLRFCTLAGNVSDNEGGAIRNENSDLAMENCILWDNEDETGKTLQAQFHVISGNVTAEYTCMMGWNPGVSGAGNFGGDPLLADLSAGDVHVQSEAGRWDPAGRTWVTDAQSSPCIDAGDPALYVGDEPLGSGGRINIGAYGGTAQASKSDVCTGGIDGTGRMAGDINRDCKVNTADFALLAKDWVMSTIMVSE